MTDIGEMTYTMRANAKMVHDIWMMMPLRRADFGPRELHDIRETIIGLGMILREINRREQRDAA